VTQAQLGLARMRTGHPAFDGEFSWTTRGDDEARLLWSNGDARAELSVRTTIGASSFRIELSDTGVTQVIDTPADLARWGQNGR